MKIRMKSHLGKTLSVTIAIIFCGALFFTLPSCSGDDPKPTPDDGGNSSIEEYLIIDGTRYEGKDFVKKSIVSNNSEDELRIHVVNESYPYIYVQQKRDGDTIPLRTYVVSDAPFFSKDLEEYEVSLTSSDGPKPVYCQFVSMYEPPSPHGKYEIKMVNGKIVAEFGKVYMSCDGGGNGTDTRVVEGRLIWEKK